MIYSNKKGKIRGKNFLKTNKKEKIKKLKFFKIKLKIS